jgi:D-arabinose 1-dehydrogenase-like Zn-dependent alcohol dehydrogenase
MQVVAENLFSVLIGAQTAARFELTTATRDGGMAPYILAEEKDLVMLPDELTYTDGAQVACGFGTVYEGLEKVGISGNDAVLVTGLGPVGLATLVLCRALGSRR